MHKLALAALAAILLGAAGPMPELARRQPAVPLAAAKVEAFTDGIVGRALRHDHVAGAVVAVVQSGRVILLKGYGLSSLNPRAAVDPARTRFRIGSISKTFTWIVLMRQVEAGRISLGAPVNRYLPSDLRIPDEGFRRPIRVVDLMDHSAGFEDATFGRLFAQSPGDLLPTREWLGRNRPRRVREPGEHPSYCNYCAVLAGYIATNAAGAADYQTLVERDILAPAGMRGTTAREPYPPRAGLPVPMSPTMRSSVTRDFHSDGEDAAERAAEWITPIAPAGSIYSTGADMARFMTILLADGNTGAGRLFGLAAAAAFRTPILPMPLAGNGWPHGFFTQLYPGGHVTVGHNGATMYQTSNMVMIPSLDLGIYINANTDTSGSLTAAFPRLLVDRFYGAGPRPPLPGSAALAATADRYVGTFVSSRRAYHGLERLIGLLTSQASVSYEPGGLLRLSGPADYDFVPTGDPDLFKARTGEGYMLFQRGADGRAASFVLDENGSLFERIPWWQSATAVAALVALGGLAALTTLLGRPFGAPPVHRITQLAAVATASAILLSMAFAGYWTALSNDTANVAYDWPGPWMSGAATSALLAICGTAALAALLPATWRAPGGWSLARKVRHTMAVAGFAAYSLALIGVGVLPPW